MSDSNSIGIIDNNRYSLLNEVLESGLQSDDVDRVRIPVGYLYVSGLKRPGPEINEFLEQGGTHQILMRNTDEKILDELIQAQQNLRLTGT